MNRMSRSAPHWSTEYAEVLALNPELIVTCAYGQMVPEAVLNTAASELSKLYGMRRVRFEPHYPPEALAEFDGQELTRALIDAYGADRVLFGTDYPMWDPQHELARLRGMHLAPETERKILYDNAAALFGLEGEN